MTNLALKYRPRTFDEVVGQKSISVILKAMVANNALEQALLFTGPSGVGKTSMGRIIAAALNPEFAEDVHSGTHFSVIEIDAASNGSVDSIRALKRSLNYAVPGHRVVILDEVHAVSPEGFAALLNLLEFPPANVTLILITTEAHKIPKTIRHRCDTYNFIRANQNDIMQRLKYVVEQEGIQIEEDLLNLISQRSEGSYRESLMILRQIWMGGITTVEQYNQLQGEVDFGPTLLKSALSGSSAALIGLEEILRFAPADSVVDRTIEALRDVIVLQGGISLSYSGKALDARLELASKLTKDQVIKAMRIIWDLQTKLANADSVRGVEMAYSLLGEILQAPKTQIPEVAPVKSAPMSFADMQRKSGS
jgi:DNA polymerase-3 subunit gamma/tau